MAKNFTIMVTANGTKVGYKFETVLAQGFGWVPGDRVAYRGAYCFIASHGDAVARFTLLRVEYAKVNDKKMDEASRYYDGTIYSGPRHQLGDLPGALEPYEPHVGDLYPAPPRVVFRTPGSLPEIVDVRDYAIDGQSGADPFRYDYVGTQSPDHVGFVAYQHQDDSGFDEPVFAIYYDRLTSALEMGVVE
jgi:hypothetical protein